jgi:hypothetical protein
MYFTICKYANCEVFRVVQLKILAFLDVTLEDESGMVLSNIRSH